VAATKFAAIHLEATSANADPAFHYQKTKKLALMTMSAHNITVDVRIHVLTSKVVIIVHVVKDISYIPMIKHVFQPICVRSGTEVVNMYVNHKELGVVIDACAMKDMFLIQMDELAMLRIRVSETMEGVHTIVYQLVLRLSALAFQDTDYQPITKLAQMLMNV